MISPSDTTNCVTTRKRYYFGTFAQFLCGRRTKMKFEDGRDQGPSGEVCVLSAKSTHLCQIQTLLENLRAYFGQFPNRFQLLLLEIMVVQAKS